MAVFNRDSQDEVSRGARAIVVHAETHGADRRDSEARLEEARGLALAIDLNQTRTFLFKRIGPHRVIFGSILRDQLVKGLSFFSILS